MRAASAVAFPAASSLASRVHASLLPRRVLSTGHLSSAPPPSSTSSLSLSTPPLPSSARVVIIGGGVVGCSVAYHLSKLGWGRDVLLLEGGSLGCGTTWHAAGLVGQLRATALETRLSVYGAQLYPALEAETGVATGFRQSGSLTVARTPERLTVLRRQADRAQAFGIAAHLISPQDAAQRWPYMRTDDLIGALWLPGDGSITSTDLTAALAAGARQGGATLRERCRVTGATVEGGRVTRLQTETAGEVSCEVVVNCAGQWAREVGALAGVSVPLHSAEHYYVITDAFKPAVPTSLPVLRDPDSCCYYREWSGGLVMGGFEPEAKPCFEDAIPHPFEFALLPDDWDQFQPLMTAALHRVPLLSDYGAQMVNGPESFTPDNRYILGEAPELDRYYVAAGMNSSGIASAGGAGKALAEWIVAGRPTMDLWAVDVRRFGRFHGNRHFLRDRTVETLGLHYSIPWPHRELSSARPMRRSPIHQQLKERGAQFGSRFGWEVPNYFIAPSASASASSPSPASEPRYSFGRQAWSEQLQAEYEVSHTGVALVDRSSTAKLLVQGRDAAALFNRLSTAAWERSMERLGGADVRLHRLQRCLLLNDAGGIEADVQCRRLSESAFLLTSEATQLTRDLHWLTRNVGAEEMVVVTDVTSAYAVFHILGPQASALLQRATKGRGDWQSEHFIPLGTFGEVSIGYSQVTAHRIDDGSGGWELLMATEVALSVFEELEAASRAGEGPQKAEALRLQPVGQYLADSLRLERGRPVWADVGSFTSPLEAGLDHLVAPHKSTPFKGQSVVEAQSVAGVNRRLVSVLVPGERGAEMFGGEPIYRGEELVGYVGSAAWGYEVKGGVGLGFVRRGDEGKVEAEWVEEKGVAWAVKLAGEKAAALVSLHSPPRASATPP